MKTATVTEAKSRLSELLRRVGRGESILILSRGRPVARLEPVSPADPGGEDRWVRLESEGRIRRGPGMDARSLPRTGLRELSPAESLLAALLEEREESR